MATAKKKEVTKHYQRWEYMKVYCAEYVIGFDENKEQIENFYVPEARKKAANPIKLDPKLPCPKNEVVTWGLAWSESNKYWTGFLTALNELGDEGWELVTVTPPWNSQAVAPAAVGILQTGWAEPYKYIYRSYFHFLLKRPKDN